MASRVAGARLPATTSPRSDPRQDKDTDTWGRVTAVTPRPPSQHDTIPGRPGLIRRDPRQKESTTMAKPAIRKPKKKANPLKAAKVENIDYKDAALLRKFISDRGKIRARRVTGVSVQEQRLIANAVKNAREMALLPYSSSSR
ncbi:hypothetical protein GCM10023153_16160 [Ornithinibacter aureus]|uniref:Small ribosomal subunit protein bS18 n=2 Tax=Intrasporangiaceae TaxID=85021 RepID=A0ABP8JQZ0_9MICO